MIESLAGKILLVIGVAAEVTDTLYLGCASRRPAIR